jgi:hypothetical protein
VPAQVFHNLAIHSAENRLYVLVGEQDLTPKGGGTDYHRKNGSEIWEFDARTGERIRQVALPKPMSSIAVSQDKSPFLYASSGFYQDVLVIDVRSGAVVRTLHTGFHGMPTILQPVEPR